MKKIIIALTTILVAIACRDKNAYSTGDSSTEIKEFLKAFPALTLPYQLTDSNIAKIKDTISISYDLFTRYIPDTVLINEFGKNANTIRITPVGKIKKESELYLLAKFTVNKKITIEAFLLDIKNNYSSHLHLLNQLNKDSYTHNISITTEPTFILSREKVNAKSELSYTRNGYAYDKSSKNFMAIINDSNEDAKSMEIINPIDTFRKANKFSGDYVKDKKNFISVRDGIRPDEYQFFIHFEKEKGTCKGELKGTMTMRDVTNAYYQQNGDLCIIDFTFKSNSISVKEQDNCGNHRGIKCFFNDTYKKKNESKPSITN